MIYRIVHVLWRQGRKHAAMMIQSRISSLWGVDIHPAAKIGSGMMIDHGTGVVVGETAVIGNNCFFLHGVTLGSSGKDEVDKVSVIFLFTQDELSSYNTRMYFNSLKLAISITKSKKLHLVSISASTSPLRDILTRTRRHSGLGFPECSNLSGFMRISWECAPAISMAWQEPASSIGPTATKRLPLVICN